MPRIDAWEQIGKFDEWLFIDLVDNEFCKRLIVSGYTILRLNERSHILLFHNTLIFYLYK